jgi:hypothetical protein
MTVQSYLELFTTMYGWGFAAIFKDILVGTGLVYLPFIFLILGTWIEAHKQASTDGADAGWMIRVMEVELGIAIFVLALCFTTVPGLNVSQVSLNHTPDATAISAPTTATSAAAGSYTNAFAGAPATVEIPAWWYFVMGVSSGIVEAAKAGIGNDMAGFRQMEEMARVASINDPKLRASVQRFTAECFTAARSKYYMNTDPVTAAGTAALGTFGPSDVEWIGSHFFQTEPGYYDTLSATRGVEGFAINPTADADVAGTAVPPDFGRPACNTWWTQLKSDILAGFVTSGGAFASSITSALTSIYPGSDPTTIEDSVIRLAINKQRPTLVDNTAIIGEDRGALDRLIQAPFDIMGIAGTAGKAVEARATLYPLVQFVSMAQPLILMTIYMFLPLIVVIGRYSLQVMFLGGLAIFTIKMWPLMWFIARVMDDHLLKAMYPDAATIFGQFFDGWQSGGADGVIKRVTLNTVLVSMYLGIPLVWSGMMGWVGYHIMRGVGEMKQQAAHMAMDAGRQGAGSGKRVIGGASRRK